MTGLSPDEIAAVVGRLEEAGREIRELCSLEATADPNGPAERLRRLREAERDLQEARLQLERALAGDDGARGALATERGPRASLARLLERLPVATVVAREDGTIRSFNHRAIELFGRNATAATTLATFLASILPESEERQTMEGAMARLRESARADAYEPALLLTVRQPGGGERVVAAECVIVDDLVVWTASDLTDVLRLQAESARLGRIVEESIDEVYVFDATTLRFRSANRSARDNVGFTVEELRERTPLDIKPELTAEAFAEKLGLLRRGAARGVRFETVHQRNDGTRYPVEVQLLMSTEGGDPVFVSITQDISVRRRAEEKIRELNAELEGRVRSRTAELEEANKELEAFAYSVSHDLRAPLRAMDGFAQLLVEEHGSGLDAEGLHYLSRVREGARRMGCLVDDLLRLSRVARAELKREEINVTGMALEILGELRASEPERRVEVVVADGLLTRADRSLFRILLENLLRNAWKFTSGREVARIELGVEGLGRKTAFFVRDDGAGFDMSYGGQLFKPFSRLHGPAEFPGTGIGLAIVDRIVRRHGGTVEASGTPGRGATFRFQLGD